MQSPRFWGGKEDDLRSPAGLVLMPQPPAGPSPLRGAGNEDTYSSANRRLKMPLSMDPAELERQRWEQEVLSQQLSATGGSHRAFPARRHAGTNASQALAARRHASAMRVRQERAAIQSTKAQRTSKSPRRRKKKKRNSPLQQHQSMPADMSKFAEPW